MGSLGEPLLPQKGENGTSLSSKLAVDSAFDAEAIVGALRETFDSGHTRSLAWREAQLLALENMHKENIALIAKAVHEDFGKPYVEALVTDGVGSIKPAANARKNLRRWMKPTKVPTNFENHPATSEILPEPYGTVLIISPWNFPVLLATEPLIGAIAAGNTILVKPSEKTPATSALLKELFAKYMDPRAIRLVEGEVRETTLLLEQKWDKIFYTGGTRIGKVIMAAAAKHLTPVTLELGGKCPVIIDSTVDLQHAARRIVSGRFFNAGQLCIAADYVLAIGGVADQLTKVIKEVLAEFYGEENTVCKDMAKIVNIQQLQRLEDYLTHPPTKNCIVFGGQSFAKERFMAPTVLRDVPWDAPIMQDEVFGPILTIQTVESLNAAIQIVKSKPKPLVAYVFSNDKATVNRVIEETSSGTVSVNECILQLSNKDLPFGGVGDSGMGKYYGRGSFDCFSHHKSVFRKKLSKDLAVRFPPYTPYKERFFLTLAKGDLWGLLLLLLGFRK